MSKIKVTNKTTWPLHGVLSWNGVQQQFFNDLKKGSSHEFEVGGGWHDLTVLIGTAENRFDANKSNQVDIRRLLLQALTIVTGSVLASVVLIPKQLNKGIWTLSTGPAGPGTGDFKLKGLDIRLNPVTVTGLYAPDGYDVSITGGEVEGVYDESSSVFTINKVVPLSLNWENRVSHTKGTEVGAK
jgi:hypothetical protein